MKYAIWLFAGLWALINFHSIDDGNIMLDDNNMPYGEIPVVPKS